MVCFSAGMLSFSRAATVILVVTAAAGVALALRENRRSALAALPALAAALAFSATLGAGARFNDLSSGAGAPTRAAIWADTLRSTGDYWLTGAGAGTFPYAFRRSAFYLPRKTVDHAHSDYLEWLLEFGLLPALLLTLALKLTLWRVGLFVFSTEDAQRRMAAGGAVLGAGAILLHATVDFPLQIPALAALTAVLLGCAAGIARPRSAGPALPPWAAAGGCWALCTAGLLSAAGVLPHDNTETLFRQGRQALLEGRSAAAEKAFLEAAETHPQAAAIWLKRAEAARMGGRAEQAAASAELAARLEPFTLRTEWTLAQAYLRDGKTDAAAGRLAGLAAALPKMRRAGYHAASGGGVPAEKIASEVVPAEPQAAADYLVYLAEPTQWPELSAARVYWPGASSLAGSTCGRSTTASGMPTGASPPSVCGSNPRGRGGCRAESPRSPQQSRFQSRLDESSTRGRFRHGAERRVAGRARRSPFQTTARGGLPPSHARFLRGTGNRLPSQSASARRKSLGGGRGAVGSCRPPAFHRIFVPRKRDHNLEAVHHTLPHPPRRARRAIGRPQRRNWASP